MLVSRLCSPRQVLSLQACALLALGSIAIAAQAQPPRNDWGYTGKTGPLNWARIDPSYRACSAGKEQSPIEMRGAHRNPNLKPIEFHYVSGGMALVNDGHTIRVTPAAGGYMVANGARYDLVEIHFQHPGETPVKGKLSDMSLELVHKSADGKMAIVAVQLNEGNANAILAGLWSHLPKQVGATDKVTDSMSPAGLLPTERAYWSYDGSLSEPPCSEGVKWFVMEQPVEISRDQLRTFSALYKVNSRLEQASHGRRIEASD